MENKTDILYLVIPCYNEQEVLPETSKRLTEKLKTMRENGLVSEKSRILFVDDGSKDNTWPLIEELCGQHEEICGLKLSRNKGHQNALLAGLMTAKEYADMIVSMDADLQDDVDAVDRFVQEYYNGCDVVYGVRSKRETDTVFKRTTAVGFYKFMKVLGVDIVENHADYRLMSKRAVEGLAEFTEVNLFLRGIVPLIGYKSAVVEYERSERFAGESKYPLKKMLSFAFDGITSFSIRPIRLITLLGGIILAASLIALICTGIIRLTGRTTGSAALLGSIWLIGGIQLLSLGVVGEYVGKIYNETKRRPRYFIDKFIQK